MVPQPVIVVSSRELTYRNKLNYHGINDVKEKDLICSSCGDRVKLHTGKVFSHPVLNTLQCLQCHNQYEDINFISDNEELTKCCRLCGSNRTLCACSTPNCPYIFCRKCIKRNAEKYLLDAESGDWNCFICDSSPLWKHRAICAVVIDSLPKKSKKTYLHSEYLPSEKRKLAQVKRVQKSLQALCDDEGASSSAEVRPFFCSPSRPNEDMSNKYKKPNQINYHDTRKSQSSNMLISTDSSSEDEVVTEISHTKSTTKTKNPFISSDSDSSSSNCTSKKKSSKSLDEHKNSRKTAKSLRKVVDSEDSDDDAEMDKLKRKKKENLAKRMNNTTTKDRISKLSLKSRNRQTDTCKSKTDDESNSSKDFQSSKLLRDSHLSKRVSSAKKTPTKANRTETSMKPKKETGVVSKQQSAYFKTKVLKIFDQFQTKCKNFIESIDDLKVKCQKKELADPDDADYIVLKSGTVINEITSFLDNKQKYLKAFYTAWNKDCQTSEDFKKTKVKSRSSTSSSDEGASFNKKNKTVESSAEETLDKGEVEVSECDSDEIFSENEMITSSKLNNEAKTITECNDKSLKTSTNDDQSRTNKETETQIAHAPSPILGVSKTKRSNVKHSDNEIEKEISKSKSKKDEIQEKAQNLDNKSNKTQPVRENSTTSKEFRKSLSESSDDSSERLETEVSAKSNRNLPVNKKINSTEKECARNVRNSEKTYENKEDQIADDASSHEDEMETSNSKEENADDLVTVTDKVKDVEKSLETRERTQQSENRSNVTQITKDRPSVEETPKENLIEMNSTLANFHNEFNQSVNDLFDFGSDDEREADLFTELNHDPLADDEKHESAEKPSQKDSKNKSVSETNENNEDNVVDVVSIHEDEIQVSKCREEIEDDVQTVIYTGKEIQKSKNTDRCKQNEETDIVISESMDAEEMAKQNLLRSDSDLSDDEINQTSHSPEALNENSTKIDHSKETGKETRRDASDTESISSLKTVIIPTQDKSKKISAKDLAKDTVKVKKNKNNKREKKKNSGTSLKSSSSDELSDDESETENAAKKALLNSSSDKQSTDSENTQAKKALLMSSNSESSNSDRSTKAQSGETGSSISTLNLSLHSGSLKRSGGDSDISVASRVKRRRINLSKNVYYMADKKLRMICQVRLERLPQKVLDRYKRALKSSMQYQRSKAIKSLIRLDNLERKKRKASTTNSNSSDDDDTHLRLHKKKKREIEAKDSLMDHLEKVKNGDVLETVDESSNDEDGNSKAKLCPTLTNKDLMSHADQIAKNLLLNSDSDVEQDNDNDNDNDSTKDVKKKVVKKNQVKDESKEKEEKEKEDDGEEENSSDDEEKRKKAKKSKWRRDKVLTMKLSDTDSEAELKKWNCSREKQKAQQEANNENKSSSDEGKASKMKKRRRRVLDSDSDVKFSDCDLDSDSSVVLSDKSNKKKDRKKKKGRRSNSSDTESSTQKKPKPKRRRIKNMSSDSDSDKSENALESSQSTPGKAGRKNIRKVLKDKQVAEDTKQAAKEEEERLKRIAERQKIYNEMYEQRLASEEKVESLVLDFDPETKEALVTVDKNLVKRLKPHQAQGVKFMWDACFESLERIKTAKASGCILAHCMGLGKTLQVVTLVHTVLTHEATGVKTVMVVCPLSTVLNWVHEFHMWLGDDVDDNDIEIYELTKFKKNFERKYQLQNWKRTGGVLVIGYDMFRTLTSPTKNMRTTLKESILECLVDPGPDVVVCDEGHILKNEDTALSKSMNRIKTLRRIVLTGTPLQNNLKEYHCMVQFVKPNLLGTKKEFLNRFVNPITNGQFDNSTEYDVKLMKKRAHVLHKMLEGSVQRFDYSVLTPFLPPKQEYVISLRLSEVQLQMYQYYLDNFSRRYAGVGGSLFADFQELQRIWTHPIVVRWSAEKAEKNEKKRVTSDSEGSLRDFIDDDTTSVSESNNSDSDSVQSCHSNETSEVSKRRTRNNSVHEPTPEPQNPPKWWSQFLKDEHFEDMTVSSKLVMLFSILKASEDIGDKVLVFSQSLYSLSLIEEFLNQIDNQTQKGEPVSILGGYKSSWSLGLDYFRLDGQTSSESRKAWCDTFNKPSNVRGRLFLISTKAGGLGINLTAANRVIIFDASWNPSHDVQSIFRVYRFGQKKPCYVYRFLAAGTMEEKIYNRQVAKLSLSCRVVDEQQIERHYSNNDLNELYKLEPYVDDANKPTLMLPKDRLLANIFHEYGNVVENCHEHDSLLENKAEEELDEEERKQAWLEYEEEKKGKPIVQLPMMQPNFDNSMLLYQYMMNPEQSNLSAQSFIHTEYENLQQLIRKDFPNATVKQQQAMANRAMVDMYNYWEKQAMLQPRKIITQQPMNAPNLNRYQYAPVQPVQMQTQQQPHQQPHQQQQQQQQQLQQQRGSLLQQQLVNAPRGNVTRNDTAHEDVVIVVPSTSTATTQGPVQSNKDQEE